MEIRSSYKNTELAYDSIFKTILFSLQPKNIIEFGILDGYSLDVLIKHSPNTAKIIAYDIFEQFNGNHANYDNIRAKYAEKIQYGNFYTKFKEIPEDSLDLIHIDIANDGSVYEFAVSNYMSKLNRNGVLILEGGSTTRDEIQWMNRFNKPKIVPVLNRLKDQYTVLIIGNLPSICLIRKK